MLEKLTLALATFILVAGVYYFIPGQKAGYDCRLAEISPDMPLAYKQVCRELRKGAK